MQQPCSYPHDNGKSTPSTGTAGRAGWLTVLLQRRASREAGADRADDRLCRYHATADSDTGTALFI